MKKILTLLIFITATGISHAADQPFDPDYRLDEARSLEAGGIEIVYYEMGEGETVVFSPPGYDYRGWQWQIEAVADAGYHAIALSYRALPSAGPQNPAAQLAAALEALQEDAGLDGPVHFVAHSASGYIGMGMAATRPDLVASLTLEEPAPTGLDMRDKEPSCSLKDPEPAVLNSCLFHSIVSGPGDFEKRSEAQQRFLAGLDSITGAPPPTPPSGNVADQFFPLPDFCGLFGDLAMPILFIRGADTPDYMQGGLDHHEGCLPEHDTVVIDGASHMVHFDDPATYNEALLSFIARH